MKSKILNQLNELGVKLDNFDFKVNKEKLKNNTDQIREKILLNLNEGRETIEKRAKELAIQAKDSKIVTEYIRPLVQSEKTEQALENLQTKLTQSKPLVSKLQDWRKQFLKATSMKTATKKKRVKKEPAATVEDTPSPESQPH